MQRPLSRPPVFSLARDDSEPTPVGTAPCRRASGRLTLREAGPGAGPAVVHLWVLEEWCGRVAVLPAGEWTAAGGRNFTLAPGARAGGGAVGDTDAEASGRAPDDTRGFTCPPFTLSDDGASSGELVLETAALRLRATLAGRGGLHLAWEQRADTDAGAAWLPCHRDRSTTAYNFGFEGAAGESAAEAAASPPPPRHWIERPPGERYFGLGEFGGRMNRRGGRYRLHASDALGYDACSPSAAAYKSMPAYVVVPREGSGGRAPAACAWGLLYSMMCDCEFDFGAQRSNYHGLFRSFAASAGDVDYCVVAGPHALDVTRRLTWLTGFPALMPRWALAYSGSAMGYTDAPDAAAQLRKFLAGCAEHGMPCTSFHLSSGYTSRAGSRGRYVFTWDASKFPAPVAFVANFAAVGVRLVANTKPALLLDHPLYAEAQAAGLLLRGADGAPAVSQWWDGLASYIDFSAPGALAWWQAQATTALLAHGVAGLWCDNNEYEELGRGASMAMFGRARTPAAAARPLQSLLMARAAAAALRAHRPGVRPFVVSRAGGAGLQRYAQTWSGDNVTAWRTLRGNLRMGLGLGLTGVANAGHDVGGFAGPPPDAELLVRWVAACALLPRFSIHSWKAAQAESTAPWTHAAATPAIAALLRLRGLLEPYLYTLLRAHAATCAPVAAPPWAVFLHDADCLAAAEATGGDDDGEGGLGDADEFCLGDALLVAPVLGAGVAERTIPRTPVPTEGDWCDFYSGASVASGAPVTLPAPWARLPLLVRAGAALPIDPRRDAFPRATGSYPHAWLLFPPAGGGACAGSAYLDDGETDDWLASGALRTLAGHAPPAGEEGTIDLYITTVAGSRWCGDASGDCAVHLWLPASERRRVRLRLDDGEEAALASDKVDDGGDCARRKLVFERRGAAGETCVE